MRTENTHLIDGWMDGCLPIQYVHHLVIRSDKKDILHFGIYFQWYAAPNKSSYQRKNTERERERIAYELFCCRDPKPYMICFTPCVSLFFWCHFNLVDILAHGFTFYTSKPIRHKGLKGRRSSLLFHLLYEIPMENLLIVFYSCTIFFETNFVFFSFFFTRSSAERKKM